MHECYSRQRQPGGNNDKNRTGNTAQAHAVYMSAKFRKIYVTFGLTSVKSHEKYLAGDVNLTQMFFFALIKRG